MTCCLLEVMCTYFQPAIASMRLFLGQMIATF